MSEQIATSTNHIHFRDVRCVPTAAGGFSLGERQVCNMERTVATATLAAANGDEQKLTAYSATVCCSVPKLPLETRCNCFRYGFFTGHRPGNLAERQLSELLTGRTRHLAGGRLSPGERQVCKSRREFTNANQIVDTTAESALHPKKLLLLSGGHFVPYVDQFEESSSAAIEWFHEHLLSA